MVWTLLVQLAIAAEPVVTSGDRAEAVARAVVATGRDHAAFEAVDFATLRTRAPALLGPGRVAACPGDATSTNEQLQFALQRAEGAVAYGENDKARTELDQADRAAACLGVPADPKLLSKLHLLRGVVATSDGKPELASSAFRSAHALGTPTWDDAWSTDARAAFDAAASGLGPAVELTVVAPDARVYVDGGEVQGPTSVRPGEHRVLVAGPRTIALTAESGDAAARLVVPAAFGATVETDEASRADTTALLAVAYGEGAPAFVVDGEVVYAVTAGRTDWVQLSKPESHALQNTGRVLAGAGAAIVVGGGIPTALSWLGAKDAAGRMTDADSSDEFLAAEADYEAAAGRLRTVRWVPVGGAALCGAGVVLAFAGAPAPLPVQPVFVEGGLGIAISVRR